MGVVDELKDLHPAVLVVGAVVVGGVALVVLVALLVVLAAVLGTFVLNLGGSVDAGVQAGATVTADADAGEVGVTWTSNQNADYLLVEWEATGGDLRPTETSGDARMDDGAVRLSSVGSAVTLAETDPGADTTVRVTVTAVDAGGTTPRATVILEREVTI